MRLIFLYIWGIILAVWGLFFIILNLNLLAIGYSFFQYFIYTFTHLECLCFYIGILLIIISYERGK